MQVLHRKRQSELLVLKLQPLVRPLLKCAAIASSLRHTNCRFNLQRRPGRGSNRVRALLEHRFVAEAQRADRAAGLAADHAGIVRAEFYEDTVKPNGSSNGEAITRDVSTDSCPWLPCLTGPELRAAKLWPAWHKKDEAPEAAEITQDADIQSVLTGLSERSVCGPVR